MIKSNHINQIEKSAMMVIWPPYLYVYSKSSFTQPMENDFHPQCLDTLEINLKKGVRTFSNMEKTINQNFTYSYF